VSEDNLSISFYKNPCISIFRVMVVAVVPMEITLMDSGGNIFVLDEFIEQMNSYIDKFIHVNSH
jgi:hypothetical protein